MATEELILRAKWHDQGFSAGAKQAQRDLAVVTRDASALQATLGALGATASQVKAASDTAAFSLGLVVEQLRHIEPAAENALDSLRQMGFGLQTFNDAQTAALASVARAVGGIIGVIVGGVGFIGSVLDSFDPEANASFDPTRIIRDIMDPGQIFEELGDFWEELQNSDLENLARYEQLTMRERRVLSELVTRFEISLLQQRTAVIIAAIEYQRARVLSEINDAEEAQRAALKRAIGLDFDFAEAELRARYQPLFAGAGGDQAQLTLLRESAGRDIDALRRDEADTLTEALHELSSQFARERTLANSFFGGLIAALHKVSEDLSKAFDNSQRTDHITVIVDPGWHPILEAIRDNTALLSDFELYATHAQDIVTTLTTLPNWHPILEAIRDNTALLSDFELYATHAQDIVTTLTTLPNWYPVLETIRDNTALLASFELYATHAQDIVDTLTTLPNWYSILEAIRDNTALLADFELYATQAQDIVTTLTTLPNWYPILEAIRDNTALLAGFELYATHAQDIVTTLTTLPNWYPILEAIRDNTASKTDPDSITVSDNEKSDDVVSLLKAIRDNTATIPKTILESPDIKGQADHNRSVRLILRSINHQLSGESVKSLEGRYRIVNDGSHADIERYVFAQDPLVLFEGEEATTPMSLFGYKTFQTDIEKIRDGITSADTTLKLISTTIPTKTENIEGKLDSVVTELKNLEKPSYTIGDIHIHAERIDEESAEEIVTEIRDRIITEFGENTELRNVRYAYAGAEVES